MGSLSKIWLGWLLYKSIDHNKKKIVEFYYYTNLLKYYKQPY